MSVVDQKEPGRITQLGVYVEQKYINESIIQQSVECQSDCQRLGRTYSYGDECSPGINSQGRVHYHPQLGYHNNEDHSLNKGEFFSKKQNNFFFSRNINSVLFEIGL